MSPVRPDAPLRKVTLNLYEADCKYLEAITGHGWTEYVRNIVHTQVQRDQVKDAPDPQRPRTLGDIADD